MKAILANKAKKKFFFKNLVVSVFISHLRTVTFLLTGFLYVCVAALHGIFEPLQDSSLPEL